MERATPKSSRLGTRLLLGLIAMGFFAYCAAIFQMGVPDWKKRSHGTYYRDKDPIPFWTQFSMFAAAGIIVAYYCINWKKGLPLVEGLEARDQNYLEAIDRPKHAKKQLSKREIQAVGLILAGTFIALVMILILYG